MLKAEKTARMTQGLKTANLAKNSKNTKKNHKKLKIFLERNENWTFAYSAKCQKHLFRPFFLRPFEIRSFEVPPNKK
jgi:hypothetical protein